MKNNPDDAVDTTWRFMWRMPFATVLLVLSGAATSIAHAASTSVSSDACDSTQASCIPEACSPADELLGRCSDQGGAGGNASGGSCTASPTGNPGCSAAGPAAAGDGMGGDVMLGGGNPINLVTGNKYQEEVDLPPLPGVLGLELKRHYNSASSHAGLMGAGWRMSYETVLYDLGGQLQILQADGQRLLFQRGVGGDQTLCASSQAQDGQIQVISDAAGHASYVWRWPDGRTLLFAGGSGGGHPLQSVAVPSGERLSLTYSPAGELVQVRDPQGRAMTIIYDSRGLLNAIETPGGRFDYRFDSGHRLTQVDRRVTATAAPLRSFLYHYEDRYNGGNPNALTGISLRAMDPAKGVVTDRRLSTYAYRADGRAILTTRGQPRTFVAGRQLPDSGMEQLDVAYLARPLPTPDLPDRSGEVHPTRPGRTIITNGIGQRTELLSATIGGHFRLLQISGAGCITCGPTDMRYGYDVAGRLLRAIKLDSHGHALTALVRRYDIHGRLEREGFQPNAANPASAIVWSKRYEYADIRARDVSPTITSRPAVIAEPSVIPGREHLLRYFYNELGQPVRIVEEGFSPGLASDRAVSMSRTVSYGYTAIHGRSLLTRIDGPLPDGPRGDPVDSDVTELRYDERGDQLIGITIPGGATTRAEDFDVQGRARRIVHDDGRRRAVEAIAYSDDGLWDRVDESAWLKDEGGRLLPKSLLRRVTRYERDALGRLQAIVRPDGTRIATEFDLAGHPVRWIAPDGGRVDLQRDGEGRITLARRFADSAGLVQTLNFVRSSPDSSRLTGLQDDLGLIARFDYGQDAANDARPVQVVRASGAITRYDYAPSGSLTKQTLAYGTAEAMERHYLESGGRVTKVEDRVSLQDPLLRAQAALFDDFGRKILYASPEHGAIRYVWDPADRLIAQVGADRHVLRLQYDVAGRLLATGVDGEPAQTRYRYRGDLRVEERDTFDGRDNHAKEVRRLDHDAFGRLVREEHWLVDLALAPLSDASQTRGRLTITEYSYDPDTGRLVLKTMLDPQQRLHRIGYGWEPATGHLKSLSFNGQPVVTDIKGSWLAGATDIAWSNGVSEHSVRDARGRLLQRAVTAQDGTVLDAASWRYDGDGRVDQETTRDGHRDFHYDARSRLIEEAGASHHAAYHYDPVDNRTSDTIDGQARRYRYQANRLLAVEPRAGQSGSLNAYDGEGGLVLQRSVGVATSDQETMRDLGSRVLQRTGGRLAPAVQYQWGLRGERVSKNVAGRLTWYEYEAGEVAGGDGLRLAAESAQDGAIVSTYLYADGRVVARVDTPEASDRWQDAWLQVRRTIFGWFGGYPTVSAIAYALHTDRRGALVAATGDAGHVVWRARYDAFGGANLIVADVTMNLRLAGQYFDAESGTNYNLRREYSPALGRYTSTDPISVDPWLGLDTSSRLAGVNPYGYVSANPLNRVDPQGLYESDVHYYMTYFLAIVAGMGADDARTMALADQYVDDNPKTQPLDSEHGLESEVRSIFHNQLQLKDYHFVLSDANGTTLPQYDNSQLDLPDSPQLVALHSYALEGTSGCTGPSNQSLEFMGEYLHAYQDTFAHRDQNNEPYDAVWHIFGSEWGIGHGLAGHDPDLTYDEGAWTVRESRTFSAESGTYSKIRSYLNTMNYAEGGSLGKVTDFNNPILQDALKAFNHFSASEEQGSLADKVQILNDALAALGYSQELTWRLLKDGDSSNGGYSVVTASDNWNNTFIGLNPSDYPAAILP